MAAQPKPKVTIEEFMAMVRGNDLRAEYFDGVVYPVAAGTLNHGIICANLTRDLSSNMMGGGCYVSTSSVFVQVLGTNFRAQPDIVVHCGAPAYLDDHRDVISNPTAIIEILSPSTEDWDRGTKLWHYSKIKSLKEHVFVSQADYSAGMIRRDSGDRWWHLEFVGADAELHLESLGSRIPLSRIYEGVDLAGAR